MPGNIEPESLQTLLKVGIEDLKRDLFEDLGGVADDPDPEVEAFRDYALNSGGTLFDAIIAYALTLDYRRGLKCVDRIRRYTTKPFIISY